MRDSLQFTAHAEKCEAEAAASALPNVRERALRSAANWRAMAERSLRMETARDQREIKTQPIETSAA